MESSLTEYMKVDAVRERTGTFLPNVAPSNNYPTKGGEWIVIGANSDNIFKRLTKVMGMGELAEDERFATHNARGENQQEIDQIISDWTIQHDKDDIVSQLDEAGVPAGGIYSVEDIANDIHYQARDMILKVMDKQMGELYMPGVVPKMSETPGEVKWTGPELGEHNSEIYKNLLNIDDHQYAELKEKSVI